MKTFRCGLNEIAYALEAVRVVKYEEDHDPLEFSTKDVIEKFISVPQNIFLVTVIDERAVGFATAYELQHIYDDKKEMFFYEIGVLQAYRRQGVGSSLIELLKQICLVNDCDEMYVPTNRSNIPAVRMYQKAGGIIPDKNDDNVFLAWRF